jgi:hypothetical protein
MLRKNCITIYEYNIDQSNKMTKVDNVESYISLSIRLESCKLRQLQTY